MVYAPSGFTIYPVRPDGSRVGTAFVTAANSSYGTSTYATLAGDLVAQQPAPQPGCDVPAPVGLWQLELSLLGQPFDFPLLLAAPAPSDPVPAAATIVLCVPSVPPAGSALPIRSLDLSLAGIPPPTRNGTYVWRALVTPVAPDGRTLRPEAAYELRAAVPVRTG